MSFFMVRARLDEAAGLVHDGCGGLGWLRQDALSSGVCKPQKRDSWAQAYLAAANGRESGLQGPRGQVSPCLWW